MSRPVPQYWWDFHGDGIIVESDYAEFPVVASFPFYGSAENAIARAESLIDDLNAWRADPRKLRARLKR